MLKLSVGGQWFKIEFRHIVKRYVKASIKSITVCTLIGLDKVTAISDGDIKFVASDVSVCWGADNFSRREGRDRALRALLDHCGATKPIRGAIWASYVALSKPRWPKPKSAPLTPEEVNARIMQGVKVRVERSARRGGASMEAT